MDLRSAVSSQIAYGTKTLGSEENADCRLESQSMFFFPKISVWHFQENCTMINSCTLMGAKTRLGEWSLFLVWDRLCVRNQTGWWKERRKV